MPARLPMDTTPPAERAATPTWSLRFRAAVLAAWLGTCLAAANAFGPDDAALRDKAWLAVGGAHMAALIASVLLTRRGVPLGALIAGAALRTGLPLAVATCETLVGNPGYYRLFGWMVIFHLAGLPIETWLSLPQGFGHRPRRTGAAPRGADEPERASVGDGAPVPLPTGRDNR